MARSKAGVYYGESGGFLRGKSEFTPGKVKGPQKSLKQGIYEFIRQR